jgi:hypothetical protein
VCGGFTKMGGVGIKSVARLLENGQLDASFFSPADLDGPIYTMLPLEDGLYIAGSFGAIKGAGQRSLARLFVDAPQAALAPPRIAADRMILRFNFVPGIAYVLETTSDFSAWTEVTSGTTGTGNVVFEGDRPANGAQFYRVRQK